MADTRAQHSTALTLPLRACACANQRARAVLVVAGDYLSLFCCVQYSYAKARARIGGSSRVQACTRRAIVRKHNTILYIGRLAGWLAVLAVRRQSIINGRQPHVREI